MKRWVSAALVVFVLAAGLVALGLYRTRQQAFPAAAATPEFGATGADFSKEKAARVEAVLGRFESGEAARNRQRQRLEESELNSYIVSQIESERPAGLESLRVKLPGRDAATIYAVVDMDKLKLKRNDLAARIFRTLLQGKQHIVVTGKLTSADGKATYIPESVTINDVELPSPLVDAILSAVGRKQKPPIDFTQPFPMPYNILDVKLKTGYVEIS